MHGLTAAVARLSPTAHLLTLLLFSTGLRIAAVANMQWAHVLLPTRDGIARTATVREKGNTRRTILLTEDVRAVLWSRYAAGTAGGRAVFARSARQLRNIFYAVCRAAGQSGAHCHPHTARHTVAHELFRVGNPIALIAKFLGHRSVQTTSLSYLQLGFEDPWDKGSTAEGTESGTCGRPGSPATCASCGNPHLRAAGRLPPMTAGGASTP